MNNILRQRIAHRLAGAVALCLAGSAFSAEGGPVAFNRDILPILSNNCFACHGPDAPARKAGLRLDVEAAAKEPLASGGVPIAAGDTESSLILHRIRSTDPDTQMPPPESGKVLSEAEQAMIVRWIAEGAPWQAHWAFIPPVRPTVPGVAGSTWPRNPIDNFVLVQLGAADLAPAPEADRHTLIRRASLALTGLPPSPEEIEAFVRDPDPQAYEALVDRLLDSPRYGEHMARHWLDLARYADTNGYAADIERTMWRYRDWVIDAFNKNMPFDQFTLEQLSGDLLPEPDLDQRIASGFNRNHPIMMEGGAIFEEYRVAAVVDRTDTTGTTWLGLTMKCAQCHDHKYDPISQREFFEMYAFFNNITEEESRLFGTELDGNSLPRIKAPLPAQQAELDRLDGAIAAVAAEKARPVEAVDAAQQVWEAHAQVEEQARWTALALAPETGATGNSVTLKGTAPAGLITALRLDVVPASEDVAALPVSELAWYVAPDTDGAEAAPVVIAESTSQGDGARTVYDGNAETTWIPSSDASIVILVPEAPVDTSGAARIRVELQGEDLAAQIDRLQWRVSSDPAFLPATLGPWQVNGPHVAASGDEALALEAVDPRNIDLAATTADGQPRWTTPADGLPDGKMHHLAGKTCATWFHRTITAPNARRMDLALDNRNAVRLWVNGRLVLDKDPQRGEVGPHPAPVTVELRAGDNSILVKTVDYYDFNAHTFFFQRKGEEVGPLPLDVAKALSLEPAARNETQAAAVRDFYRSRHWNGWAPLHEQALDLAWARAQVEREIPTVMVMEERADPRPTHVLIRGLYDQPGDPVAPGVPAALHPWPDGAPPNRLGFAQWVVAPENPLTARVVVNRYWQRVFGEGIVRTPDDFGIQGERPTHPELLDWLAREFIESGWDIRAMQRLLVTSATFRQASRRLPASTEVDPDNRFLARGPRYRLDAEQIRDNALAASGLLAGALGGPSVKPYQPPGLWRDVAYGGGGLRYTAQEFIQDHGEKLYRRSLYTFWKRAAAPPGMLLFDAPNRDICTARRSRSNTPLQALALMNDTQYVEVARKVAERLMREGGDTPEGRIHYGALLALGRPPRPAEEAALRAQYEAQLADYRRKPEAAIELLKTGESTFDTGLDAAELAAWTLVANALLSSDAAVSQN